MAKMDITQESLDSYKSSRKFGKVCALPPSGLQHNLFPSPAHPTPTTSTHPSQVKETLEAEYKVHIAA